MVFWLVLILLACAFGTVWSNHFQSGFHLEDKTVIETNRAIRSLANIPRFFANPLTFSARPEEGAYQPLLTTAFAVDYAIDRQLDPLFFQIQNFLWFLLELGLLFVLFRVIPGGARENKLTSAFCGMLLYGLHPLAAETLNYALQRGMIYSAAGVFASLFLWIAWPRLLPPDFLLNTPRVPKNEWDLFRIKLKPVLSSGYRRVIGLPVPFYLFPVLIVMFAGPAGVAFVPILVIYIWIFEPKMKWLRALPAAVLFGAIWIFQTIVVLSLSRSSHVPFVSYIATQPWVVLRYLFTFFFPFRIGGVSSLVAFPALWSPLALAGYAGVALLVCLAAVAARRDEWKAVSFGLWWFLLALLPTAIVPQKEVEALSRAFIAYAGLTLAVVRTVFILLERVEESRRALSQFAAAAVGVILLATLGWETYQRNDVWQSDETLWSDVIARHPNDGKALMHYGLLYMDAGAADVLGARYEIGFDSLTRAAALLPHDPELETELGIACEQMGRDADAEMHLKRAISFNADYAPAYAAYSDWLLNHLRNDEAFAAATKAAQLDSVDVVGRRTLADIYVQRGDWANAVKTANDALRIDPDDAGAQRSLHVADSGIAANENTRKLAETDPTVDHFLALSVLYYQERKYEQCIQAGQQALNLDPNLAEAYVNIAAAWHAMGKEDETIAALKAALKIRPDLEVAKHNLEYEVAHTTAARTTGPASAR
ncbi:MAG TPA: tetratricopeptide repeat protein [Bryobacteraceae bacterium]|nr:tetratricopeptide repeat protein [Bryobacteraceae bacterium]